MSPARTHSRFPFYLVYPFFLVERNGYTEIAVILVRTQLDTD